APGVDRRTGILAVLALQQFWRATGVFDILDTPLQLTHGVMGDLAVLFADQAADLVCIAFQQFLEAEHDLGALEWWGVAPGGIRGFGRGYSGFDGGFTRQRHLLRCLTRRRVENVLGAAGLCINSAVDRMSDCFHRLSPRPVVLAV